jgi:Flp pilus assembly protein TadD
MRHPLRRLPDAAVAAALGLGALALYAQVASFPFILFDDTRYVLDNPVVRDGLTWEGVRWAFTALHASNWHPFTWLSHMLDVELFGLEAGAHHAVNAVLHATNAGLLFIVLARTTGARGASAAVAALFAVHPLHVESVAWVAERKDLLSTLFGFAALGAWARYARSPRPGRYAAVCLLFAASLLSKPMWVTFPALLLLLDVWPLQRVEGMALPRDPAAPVFPRVSLSRALGEKLPLLVLAAASSLVTIVAQQRGGSLTGLEMGLGPRAANAVVAYATYLAQTIWPVRLSVFYPHPVGALAAQDVALAAALLGALTAGAVAVARRAPWVPVGWLWFLGTLVPVIGLVQVGAQAHADRYTYLPHVGLFVAVAFSARLLPAAARRLAPAGVALAMVALAAVTWLRVADWASHEQLFRAALAVSPGNALAHAALGDGARAAGRSAEALLHAREAARLDPASPRLANNLGVILREAGLLDEAREALWRAAELDPDYLSPHVNLAQLERQAGDPAAAADALGEVLRLRPGDLGATTDRAMLLEGLGRTDEARAAFQGAVDLHPESPVAWRNLAVFHARHGALEAAERALREAEAREAAAATAASR